MTFFSLPFREYITSYRSGVIALCVGVLPLLLAYRHFFSDIPIPQPRNPQARFASHEMTESTFDVTKRRQTSFVLWIPSDRPANVHPPLLILGKYDDSQPNDLKFKELVNEALSPATDVTGLWEISCEDVNKELRGQGRGQSGVFIYWFKVQDTSPNANGLMHVTDPLAYALDYRVVHQPGDQPASVTWIDVDKNRLLPCDHQGIGPVPDSPAPPDALPRNEQLVIYEIPTSFSRGSTGNDSPDGDKSKETDIGTFRDVASLFKDPTDGTSPAAGKVGGVPYLTALGINALELTPPADAKPPQRSPPDHTGSRQEWGYATAHYFAPDYQLGYSDKDKKSTAVEDLSSLVQTCHKQGVRFISDVVLAFGHDPYKHIAFRQFHIIPDKEPKNPDSYQSDKDKQVRQDWGGKLWRYIKSTDTYDPVTGKDEQSVCPASSFHLAHLKRWITYYKIDGLRLDSIENVANREFLKGIRDQAHNFFDELHQADPDKEAIFLVVGEELSMPRELISDRPLDGFWNEQFKNRLRKVILGQTYGGEDFGNFVNSIVDPRALDLGFENGARAINYITCHDTEGDLSERLYNYLGNNGIEDRDEKKKRVKLAFAILLTSIGTPMIYAGEEFCDRQDRAAKHPTKQVDPVNYSRASHPWRKDLLDTVSRLAKMRTRNAALWGNNVNFTHWDFQGDRKIMAWIRGGSNNLPVVIVANFSGVKPDGNEYSVNGWPTMKTWKGKEVKWREVTEGRNVPPEWVNREPVYAWEAKVYESYIDR